jgi:hypothetical protein
VGDGHAVVADLEQWDREMEQLFATAHSEGAEETCREIVIVRRAIARQIAELRSKMAGGDT